MKPIPRPRSLPIFGTMLSILASGGASKLHLYVDRRHKELGPIYREKIGPVWGVFVSDGDYARKIFGAEGKYPKHIVPDSWLLYNKMYECKRGLLFMDDEEWLSYRKTLNKLLLKVRVDEFYTPISLVAESFVEKLKEREEITKVEQMLYKWSVEVIVAVLLGTENYAAEKSALEPSIERLSETVHRVFVETGKISLVPAKIARRLKLPAWNRFVSAARSALSQGKEITEKILRAERRRVRKGNGNLVSKILESGMASEDLTRIVTDLILAAGDTSVHATQWLFHLLSLNPSCQTLICQEMSGMTKEDCHRSPLLKAALREALRLYPVAPFITRFLPEDLVLDEYRIEAKELVLMSQYTSGRNEKYFPMADTFLPQRWLKRHNVYEGVTNSGASLPFAMGARSCVGKRIAETQMLVTASKVLQKYVIRTENTKMIDATLHLVSVPSEPIAITLEKRRTHQHELKFLP